MIRKAALMAVLSSLLGSAAAAQTTSGVAASAVWSTLSSPAMDPAKFAHTENVSIVRDRVHITLIDGTIQFTQSVNGVVFGAVFHGSGRLQADPPNPIEAQQLHLFTKQDNLDMTFSEATFSFTDGLLEEVAKQSKWKDGGPASDELYAKRQREREDLCAGYLPRLFKSVFSPDLKRTAFFLADLKTREKGWVEVRDDAMQPEEIRIGRWADLGGAENLDYWMIFPAAGRDPRHAYDDPAARQDFLIPGYQIKAGVADNAELDVTTKVTVQPRYSGERILLFHLDSNLRITSVNDGQGRSLEYFQSRERKDRYYFDRDYVAMSLNEPTIAGQNQSIEFHYAGKRVVRKVGNGNYFCESFGWYPSAFSDDPGVETFAFRSDFELTFESPKRFSLVATGNKVGETTDGKQLVTNWKSDLPLAAAGFVFGDYKITKEKVGDVEIQVYANNEPDDLMKSIQPGSSLSYISPSALSKTIAVETANTLRVFQNYFGPYPYRQLVVTNIVGTYGQGWPGLLYLSWLTFLDSTQRHGLGIRDQVQLTDYFRGHESSHQWWGHRVGWKSFHDQWLSEGFAEFSGILFVQFRDDRKESIAQFRKLKEYLHAGDIKGHQVDSLGPIWMGRRIRSSETGGGSYQNLIYSKGGYVLQMLRAQLNDSHNSDPEHLFKEMMQDYCKTFDNKPASTEDFKAIVEKHMTQGMNLDGNHKMDWFFNQYVYGTGIPQYNFHVSLSATADGKTSVAGELTRSGVAENWKDVVPLYAHIGDKTMRLGSLGATHSVEKVNFLLSGKIDRVSINDDEDLLADVKQ